MPEETAKWTAYTLDNCIELVCNGSVQKHIIGGHDIGQPCWCKFEKLYYCDCISDVDNEPDPNCWKCQGDGMTEHGDGPYMIHHEKTE